MANIVLKGNTSGSITIASPDVSGVNVLTLPVETGTILTTNTPLPEVSSVEFAGAGTSSGNITITAPDTDETNTLTFPETTGTFATENSLGMRNFIINGDMMIDQRNGGSDFTITADNKYGLDRWVGRTFGGAGRFSMQRVEDAPSGFVNSNEIIVTTTATSGAGGYGLEQRIEGNNLTMLNWGTANAKSLTASFWIKSSVVGTYSCALRTSTSSVSGISYCVNTFTISTANTWQKVIQTFPANTAYDTVTNNLTGIYFDINFGAQTTKTTSTLNTWTLGNFLFATGQTDVMQTSGATINITGVQLEANITATPFENLMFQLQLALCQRYYQTISKMIGYSGPTTSDIQCSVAYPIPMRATPTISQSSVFRFDDAAASFTQTSTGLGLASTNNTGTIINVMNITVNGTFRPHGKANTATLNLNAEL